LNNKVYRVRDLDLSQPELLVSETLFHNANGYLGVRSCFEEGYAPGLNSIRGTYINGFYDIAPMKQAETLFGLVEDKEVMLNVADTQGVALKVCGEPFSMFQGEVLESERMLDMKAGVTTRRVVWRSPAGREIEVTVDRMASFIRKPLFLIDYHIKALNFTGTVELTSTHSAEVMNFADKCDPRLAQSAIRHLSVASCEVRGDESFIVSTTNQSGLSVCSGVKNVLSKPCRKETYREGSAAGCRMEADICAGETISLAKYTVLTDSRLFADCRAAALREMKRTGAVPPDELYGEQRAYLDAFWKNAVLEIDGDADLTCAVNYNLYQLLQSAGSDRYSGIASKGLSGEGYEGHYFWDTEMYILPFFTLTNPDIAKSLLSYRYATLGKAKENARRLGHKQGALFPWRTISGRECSGYFPAGTAQYHINGDIAYAAVSYWLATGDTAYLESEGLALIVETARLWMDLGCWYRGSFRLNDVTGPDEYTCMVDNNYYTNVCAQFNLRWAVKAVKLLQEAGLGDAAERLCVTDEELATFAEAAEGMYLPYDSESGIIPQDDSFLSKPVWDIEGTPREQFPLLLHYHPLHLYRYQVCKQADTILAFFMFGCERGREVAARSFDYYERITTHDSSLSMCVFSMVASMLKNREKAYAYFGNSAMLDLKNTYGNTKDGIHTANMGGLYMSIVHGFGGLRIREDGLHLAPAVPENWKGFRFSVTFHGSRILVEADKNGCGCTLAEGEGAILTLYGREYRLDRARPSCRAALRDSE